MSCVLLFGGSFDPVHNAHLLMLEAAMLALAPSKTLVLPAGQPWQKAARVLAPAAHRLSMLQIALNALPSAQIDARELHRKGATYTVETLHELQRESDPQTSFVWLIGSDAFSRLGSWHRGAELIALTRFLVASRSGEVVVAPRLPMQQVSINALASESQSAWAILPIHPPSISSTALRAAIAQRADISAAAPSAVCEYIEAHQLYR